MIINAELTRLLEKLSNIHNTSPLVITKSYTDNELETIGQALENRRQENEITFELGIEEREKGVIALTDSLKKNRRIRNITLCPEETFPEATSLIFMDFLKSNHNLEHFTLLYWRKKIPPENFIDYLYSALEKHPSIKSVSFIGVINIDLYIDRFFKLKNITSIELQNCDYHNANTFFASLNFPAHLETFKLTKWNFRFDSNSLKSFMEAIKKSNLKMFDFGMPYLDGLPEIAGSKESFVGMLMKKESLTSLSVDEGNEHSFCKKPFKSFLDVLRRSDIEELFNLLKNSKTLKELSINNTPFMKKVANINALCRALTANKNLTTLRFNNIVVYGRDVNLTWYGLAGFELLWGGLRFEIRYSRKFINAIFSNPNLKSLTLLGSAFYKECHELLVEKLISGHGLTELNLSGHYYEKEDAKLFADLLEKNTALESLDLSGSGFDSSDAELFLTAMRKNKDSNLVHFDILFQPCMWENNESEIKLRISDKVIQDINAELEKNVKKKWDKICNILLEGTKCKRSSLKALHGKEGPLGLICDFLYERGRPKVEPGRLLETKEQKEKRESQSKIVEPCQVSYSVEIKKMRDESWQRSSNERVKPVETAQSNAAPISPAYLKSLSREALSTTPSVFLLLASYNNRCDTSP